MRRRAFVTLLCGTTVAWPLRASAQRPEVPVIGFLSSTTKEGVGSYLVGLARGLAEAGYTEGRNLQIEYRWADDQTEQLPALAANLVKRGVSAIVTSAIRATLAAKAATSTIPIVFATANDPVQFGLVVSLNRPGGNLTGVSYLSAELGEKRLQLLHELVPATSVIAILVNPKNANAERNVRNAAKAAQNIGLSSHVLDASSEQDYHAAFAKLARLSAGAMLILNDPLFFDQRLALTALAAKYSVPVMYSAREYADAGGLISYGANQPDAYRQVGNYVGLILKGAKPSDLPVQQPTKFELVINLKTAKALGLEIPATLLARADEVIE